MTDSAVVARRATPRWRTGAVAGLVAGLVMTVWKMGEAVVTGAGAWRPPNLIATIVLGPSADTGAFSAAAFAVGMTLHLIVSIGIELAYGALAAWLLPALSWPRELGAIVVYALASWVIYQWLIMPWLLRPWTRERRPSRSRSRTSCSPRGSPRGGPPHEDDAQLRILFVVAADAAFRGG